MSCVSIKDYELIVLGQQQLSTHMRITLIKFYLLQFKLNPPHHLTVTNKQKIIST